MKQAVMVAPGKIEETSHTLTIIELTLDDLHEMPNSLASRASTPQRTNDSSVGCHGDGRNQRENDRVVQMYAIDTVSAIIGMCHSKEST